MNSLTFLIAPLMRTTGVASEMLVPRSSICCFISPSSSLIRCSSLLRSLMASVCWLYVTCCGDGGRGGTT